MEQHIIPLNQGIHLTPSAAEDGQLADCINLVPKDGSLRNAPQLAPATQIDPTTHEPSQIILATGHTLEFIHTTALFTNYITKSGQSLYLHPDTSTPILTLGNNVTIHQITSVGNTIIVLASDSMHYILWKNETVKYKYLGTRLPELPLSFGLQGRMYEGEEKSVALINRLGAGLSGKNIVYIADVNASSEDNTDGNVPIVTEAVLAQVNKFLDNDVYSKGYFVEPFFVRYAYRLYDQSLVMHSAPVLMVCCTDIQPMAAITGYNSNAPSYGLINAFYFRIIALRHQLDYAVQNSADITNITEWSDIIQSVDVFISKPIRTYDQNGKVVSMSRTYKDYQGHRLPDSVTICKVMNQKTSQFPTSTFPMYYQRRDMMEAYIISTARTSSSTQGDDYYFEVPEFKFDLPKFESKVISRSIEESGSFYLLKKINLEELSTTRTVIGIEKDYLNNLVTREVMTDDYQSHDPIIPKRSFVYNSRLNVTDIDRSLFNGFPAAATLPYTDGFKNFFNSDGTKDESTLPEETCSAVVKVLIEESGKQFFVESPASFMGVKITDPLNGYWSIDVMYFFYPNRNAKKAYFTCRLVNDQIYEIDLSQHTTLNGAFYFKEWEDVSLASTTPSTSSNNTIPLPNKIYTSEVNNPFYFPASGINTIGTGEIIGLCSAVKALSQGQFGQFPLYAFATDGIWALEVKDDGTYSVKQPVTRDVCTNPNSIVQTDSAVLYATERGLHLLQGSETKLLTSALEAHTEDSLFTTTSEQGKININTTTAGFPEITSSVLATVSLLSQLQTCSISYDGINHIVHVYPPTTGYTHYILHLDSMEWTRTTQSIPSTFIDGYPNATLQIGQALWQYALPSYDTSVLHQGFLLTRETALGSPTTHKILKDMRTLKHWYSTSSNHKVRIIPLISNDRLHWYRLTSLHANSAIWYRFAIFTLMADSDVLEALTLVTEDRRTNKLR